MKIFSIPGKLEVTWNSELKAIIDTWQTYHISLPEFREAVLVKGLDHSKANGGIAWIVDSSLAEGVFTQEIHRFIDTDIFPAFARNGVKYFITITSTVSALTKLNVMGYSAKTGPNGLKLVELNSTADAIEWLRKNA